MINIEKNLKERIGEKLSSLRRAKKLTTKQLSDMIGINGKDPSPSYITQIEKGQKTPSLETALKLSHFFEISLDELVNPNYSYEHIPKIILNFKKEGQQLILGISRIFNRKLAWTIKYDKKNKHIIEVLYEYTNQKELIESQIQNFAHILKSEVELKSNSKIYFVELGSFQNSSNQGVQYDLIEDILKKFTVNVFSSQETIVITLDEIESLLSNAFMYSDSNGEVMLTEEQISLILSELNSYRKLKYGVKGPILMQLAPLCSILMNLLVIEENFMEQMKKEETSITKNSYIQQTLDF
ncbi:helix-turn-helix domain-containing protein [Mesobacillus maritimus]|uniref:helix-turn-helix domain-containing protein n=1 Tax=Mesobacillus maritimus TaxID=1643336 RepID=UPI003850F7CF